MANKKERLILVTGATGKQGSAAVRHLRDRGFSVRALTRDPDKPAARALIGARTEVVRGDFDHRDSLRKVLDGAYGVFAVLTAAEAGAEAEVREGKTLANTARAAEVRHYVYSSVASSDQHTGIPHFESKFQIEEYIRTLGMPFSFLRPVFFMENLLGMAGMIREGTLRLPLTPDRTLQMIAVDDIGGVAATALEHPQRWIGRAEDIAGDEVSMENLAGVLSRVLMREVRYEQVPWDQFEQQTGSEMTKMWRYFQETGFHIDITALRQEYPRLTSLERWVQQQNWEIALGAR